VGDFVELIIFLAVVLVAMLAGGKKRGTQQQQRRPPVRRPTARPVQRPDRARPVGEWREPGERPAPLTPVPTETAGEPTRQSVAREILELLGAQLEEQQAPPEPPTAPPREAVALDDYRRDAVSLERASREQRALDSVELSREREHEEFHDSYVDAPRELQPRRSRSRYHRITPRTAREAVIWKTILSPPKALE
jgi:hypothetical protein